MIQFWQLWNIKTSSVYKPATRTHNTFEIQRLCHLASPRYEMYDNTITEPMQHLGAWHIFGYWMLCRTRKYSAHIFQMNIKHCK